MNAKLETNPLYHSHALPAFDVIEAEHVVPGIGALLDDALAAFDAIEAAAGTDWETAVAAVTRLELPIHDAWSTVSHLHSVMNSDALREAYDAVQGRMVQLGLRVGQSEPLYRALVGLRDGDGWASLDEAQQRIVTAKIRAAELSGVALEGPAKVRFNEIAEALSKLSTQFSNHVLDATKAFEMVLTDPAEVDGLPRSARQLMAQSYSRAHDDATATPESGPWRVTLDYPIFRPFLQHATRRDLREQLYRAFVTRASSGEFDNWPLIDEILALRVEKARLLGYANYAEVSLASKMATLDEVRAMLERLRAVAREPATEEIAEITAMAQAAGHTGPLASWDTAFWRQRLEEERFGFTDDDLRPYFPMPRVLDGLFGLCRHLFGIRVESANEKVPLWHADARYYEVFDDASGEQIAAFYLDPYSRPETKRGGAWMGDCRQRRRLDATLQLPVAYLVCNGTPPVGDQPSLMSFDEVLTLFHEFGHGLQHMLTTVDHADAAGIAGVEWDAVELPSQFMENWCYHRPTVMSMTAHVETGAPLPDELFDKLCDARTFFAGNDFIRQIFFGTADIELHADYDPAEDETPKQVQDRVAAATTVVPSIPEAANLCSFGHIFAGGYAAGYYSYKWAEVLSADAFGAFEEAGLDNPDALAEMGRRLRDTVLSLGGGRHPSDVYRDFRGRDPDPDALLQSYGLLSS